MQYLINGLLLVLGFVMLWKGADWFVDGASSIATKLKIPQIVIGLTIVAMGTSMPEATVSIMSSVQGSADLAVGNVLGSNVLNVLIILGISALVLPLVVKKDVVFIDIPFVIFATFLLIIMGLDGSISRIDGCILIISFIIYMSYLFVKSKKEIKQLEMQETPKTKALWLSIVFTIIGLVCIIFGSRFTINSATFFAKKFGVSDRIIALTIVALGTSLPELFTSVIASKKNNPDIAIGNVVGSNIFNLLFVLPLAALARPLIYSSAFTVDAIFAVVSVVALFIFVIPNKKLNRLAGAIFLLAYVGYFFLIF